MTSAIEAADLGRAYAGRSGVSGLRFAAPRGCLLGLLGPNGAGKTTTLRMLAGTLLPTSGTAKVAGFDLVSQAADVRARVGWMPERPPLYLDNTVRGQLQFCADLRQLTEPEAKIDATLRKADLLGLADRRIGNLSHGMGQRVGIATAILHEPAVLLLDEPTSGLDPAQRRDLLALVRALAAEGTTVVLSTHVLAELESTADRLLVLRGGRQVADASTAELEGASVLRVRVGRPHDAAARLLAIEGVSAVDVLADGALDVTAAPEVAARVAAAMVELDLLELSRPRRLEEALLRLVDGP